MGVLMAAPLSVPTPIDGLTPDNTLGGVYLAIYDAGGAGASGLMDDLHDGYYPPSVIHVNGYPYRLESDKSIWKHLRKYVGSTDYFYGRWKQHRRGPKYNGSPQIWEVIQGCSQSVAFSVIHDDKDLERGFIHTSGASKDSRGENILCARKIDPTCLYCQQGWGLSYQNRDFIPRFHNIWDDADKCWIEFDAREGKVTGVRHI